MSINLSPLFLLYPGINSHSISFFLVSVIPIGHTLHPSTDAGNTQDVPSEPGSLFLFNLKKTYYF